MNRVLLDLQQLDTQILGLSRAKKALDDGTSARTQRDATRTLLEAARVEERGVGQTRRSREGELEATEAKIARQKARLGSSSSAGDVAALERDLVGLSHARGELDETILELMDEGEELQKRIEQLESELLKNEEEVALIEADFASQSGALDKQMAAKRVARPAIANMLSPAETEKYGASFKKFAGVGVSEAVKGVCSACGTSLSRDFLRDAAGEAFPQCESCGRLIFVGAS
jgi:predicted  nucleic acid-binding Zn-ribbon protein